MTRTSERNIFHFDRFSGLYLWGLFIAVFGVWVPELFLTRSVLHSVAAERAIPAMLGLALLIPLAAGAYDLSIGATVNLSTILVTVLLVQHHWNMWLAISAVVAASALIGVINGFIVVQLKVNSFIATLGTATIIQAVQTIVTNSRQPNPITNQAFVDLAQRSLFGFQIVFFYLLILAVVVWWVLEHTPAGRFIYAVGGNPMSAKLSGISVGRWTWLSLIASSTICGVAGVFYASLTGPSLTFGNGLLLPAFAAAFLGSTQIRPGKFNVWGSVLAVYVLATGVAGLQLVTGVQWLNQMFNGVAVIAAVAFAVWRQTIASRKQPRGGTAKAHGDDDLTTTTPDSTTTRAGLATTTR